MFNFSFYAFSAYDLTINPLENALVKTDIAIKVPVGCYGRIAPRSGLALKKFIDVGGNLLKLTLISILF